MNSHEVFIHIHQGCFAGTGAIVRYICTVYGYVYPKNSWQTQPSSPRGRDMGMKCILWVLSVLKSHLYHGCAMCRIIVILFRSTVYPKKYAQGFVVLCFVVVMQSFIMNSHEVFIHIHQGCFAGTGAIVRLPQCQWRKPDGYGKTSQCITTTKHSKAKTVCIFLGIYCISCQVPWAIDDFV